MPGRLLVGCAALAIGLAVPSAASADMTCTHSGPPANTVTFTTDDLEATLELERAGDEIRLTSEHLDPVRRKGKRFKLKRVREAAVCPIAPTVFNTDRIEIAGDTESQIELDISLQGGPFAPGPTAEPGGGAEIEIGIQTGFFGGARFVGGEGDDAIRLGSIGGTIGANLNPAFESVPDVDATLTIVPPELPPDARITPRVLPELVTAAAAGRGGNDTITTGGPEFESGFVITATLKGNDGDDVIVASSAQEAEIKAGPGADTIHAAQRRSSIEAEGGADTVFGQDGRDVVILGPGRDFADLAGGQDAVLSRDGRTDRVRCGGERDLLIKDREDRLKGCERQLKRLPRRSGRRAD